MRGLKYRAWTFVYGNAAVASFMDAWIEIDGQNIEKCGLQNVASFMDAWIEIWIFTNRCH